MVTALDIRSAEGEARRLAAMRTPEFREKMSRIMKPITSSPEVRKRISEGTKKGLTPEAIAKGTAKKIGRILSEEHKQKTSNSLKGYRAFRFNKGRKRGRVAGFSCTPEHIEKVRQAAIARWHDPVWRAKEIKALLEIRSPNNMEVEVLGLLNDAFNNEWKFVGDGQLIIGGLSPDFVNINGKKLIIEFFGRYWHKPQDERFKQKVYSQFGYKTLVIWSEELKNKTKLIERIGNWIEAA